ncbi:MAG: DUF5011 domain-containing protein, partial [Dehalococcoidales bacterium]|nr:DUF5011 domain-containing protein [Dehalococcoidales bacterium]
MNRILKRKITAISVLVLFSASLAPLPANQVFAAATSLRFAQQPSSTATVDVLFSQQAIVEIVDEFGVRDTTANNTISIFAYSDSACTSPASSWLNGTMQTAAVNGVLTYTNHSYPVAETIYLGVSSDGLVSACSNAIVVSAAADTTPPVITILGNNPETVLQGSQYTDAGATAIDNVDGNITASIITVNNVNTSIIGTYTVTYNVTDAANNPATEAVRTVNVEATTPPDTTSPVITLQGPNPMDVVQGDSYVEPGYTATDNVDGNITANVVVTGTVNISVLGQYTLTYSVSDAASNPAQVTRTVNVIAAVPVATSLSFNQQPASTATVDTLFSPQATVSILDQYGSVYATGNNTISVAAFSNSACTVSAPGLLFGTSMSSAINGVLAYQDHSYSTTGTIYLGVTASGLTSACSNAIVVSVAADTTPPAITILGNNPEAVIQGSVYTDAGATAWDNVDGDITSSIVIVNNVNTAVVGSYTVTYNVSDAAGNPATQVVRTVSVTAASDTTPPVITILGNNPETVVQSAVYNDAGATASDNVDGNLTSSIVVVNNVNTSAIGTYTVTYNVSDAAGNPAVQVARTVNVVAAPDTTPPVITLSGLNPMNINQGTAYSEPGYTATDNVDGNITGNVLLTGTVNSSVPGQYILTYSVSDAAGNPTSITRTVNVVAAPAVATSLEFTQQPSSAATINVQFAQQPIIAIKDQYGTIFTPGNDVISLAAYTNPSCTTQVVNGMLVGGTGGSAVSGVFSGASIKYTFAETIYVKATATGLTSACSNAVIVSGAADTIPPVITLAGANPMNIIQGTPYFEPGYTATDNVDGDITANVTVTGSVDVNTVGQYVLTYLVLDAAGNSTSINRDVYVLAPNSATSLIFTQQPSSAAQMSVAFAQQPIVEIQDQTGTTVTAATDTVTLTAFEDAACTIAAPGTLFGQIAVSALNGVVTYAGLGYLSGGTIHLGVSSGTLTPACSNAIVVSVPAFLTSVTVTPA